VREGGQKKERRSNRERSVGDGKKKRKRENPTSKLTDHGIEKKGKRDAVITWRRAKKVRGHSIVHRNTGKQIRRKRGGTLSVEESERKKTGCLRCFSNKRDEKRRGRNRARFREFERSKVGMKRKKKKSHPASILKKGRTIPAGKKGKKGEGESARVLA